MYGFLTLKMAAPLLAGALAFGQAGQSATAQSGPPQPATAQQKVASPPATLRPAAPRSVADAAGASKQAQTSAPPVKVYRNKDVKDPAATGKPAIGEHNVAAPSASQTAAQTAAEEIQKDRAFEAQGSIFKNQIRAEKGNIVAIQNRMRSLKYQFDAWSTEFSQDPTDAQACWTSQYYAPYYKDWCDAGRNLKAQYDETQVQLNQEKTRLEQMQENIRRKGYGNGVYDAD
ncbi:MAG: hypothetical protein WAL32_03380 [Terriglobales bacterium]